MRSIPAQPAQPSALRIYQDVMQEVQELLTGAQPVEAQQRTNKLLVREAIVRKHADRSLRASEVLSAQRSSSGNLP